MLESHEKSWKNFELDGCHISDPHTCFLFLYAVHYYCLLLFSVIRLCFRYKR